MFGGRSAGPSYPPLSLVCLRFLSCSLLVLLCVGGGWWCCGRSGRRMCHCGPTEGVQGGVYGQWVVLHSTAPPTAVTAGVGGLLSVLPYTVLPFPPSRQLLATPEGGR